MQSSHPLCIFAKANLEYAKWLHSNCCSASQRRPATNDDLKSKSLSLSWSTDHYESLVDKRGEEGRQQQSRPISVDEYDDHRDGLNIVRYNSWV